MINEIKTIPIEDKEANKSPLPISFIILLSVFV